MEYIIALESGSSPKIAKAAQNIIKQKIDGYCPYLLEALMKEITKPKAWKSQSQLVKAIGIGGCQNALKTLNKLIEKEYEHTILYRELAFAIFMIENSNELNLEPLYQFIKEGCELQISGACSAILYKEMIPSIKDIEKIISGISSYTKDEGQVISPRCYIAAVAHLWPKEVTVRFLEDCKNSKSALLVEIAESALKGKASKIRLI